MSDILDYARWFYWLAFTGSQWRLAVVLIAFFSGVVVASILHGQLERLGGGR